MINDQYLLKFEKKSRKQAKAIYDVLEEGDNSVFKKEVYDLLLAEIFYFLAQNGVSLYHIKKIMSRGNTWNNSKIQSTINMKFKKDCGNVNDHCFLCGSDEDLTLHHVKRKSDYPWLQYRKSNILKLCASCHNNFHNIQKHKNKDLLLNLIKNDEL